MRALVFSAMTIVALSCGHPSDISKYPLDTSCLRLTLIDTVAVLTCGDTLRLRVKVVRCDTSAIRIPLSGGVFRLAGGGAVQGDSGKLTIVDYFDEPLIPIEGSGQLPLQTIPGGDSVNVTAEFYCSEYAVTGWNGTTRIFYNVAVDFPEDKRRYYVMSTNLVKITILPPSGR